MKWVSSLLIVCAICAIPNPIDAQSFQSSTINAVELFARVNEAYGKLIPGAYHRVERAVTSDGEVGTTETYTKGSDFKSVSTMSGIQRAGGRFQGRAWVQDANGGVRSLSDDAQPDPFRYASEHPGDPASGVKLLGIAGTPPQYVVQLDPRRGLHQLRYFDVETYFLTRTETADYDGHTRVTVYSNYKCVGGQFVPMTSVDSDNLSKRTTRTDIMTYESIPENEANVAVPASKKPFDLAGRSSVTFPAKFLDGQIDVTVTISGKPYNFALDSGASSSLMDSGTARSLNLSVLDQFRTSFGGDFTVGYARVPNVSVGDVRAENVVMAVGPHLTGNVVGLLGCDFFESGAVLVDFGNETVTLMDSAPADPAAEGWNSIPIALNGCTPGVHATFDGVQGSFIVDLGAFATVLSKHYFERLSIAESSAVGLKAPFIGGAVDMRFYSIDEVLFGGTPFKNVGVLVPTSTAIDMRTSDGLIGQNFLHQFNLLFDYAHEKLYFKSATSGAR